MTRSPLQAINQPFTADTVQFQWQGARPKTPRHVGFPNPPWTMVTDSRRTGQECSTDQRQGQDMAATVAPELPEEDWDDELTLPSGPLDWEQIVDQATATEGGETYAGVQPVKTEDGETPTWAGPKAGTEA